MSDMMQECPFKAHVKDKDAWMRFAYLVIFSVAFYLAAGVMFFVALFQFLSKLFGGQMFPVLADLGEGLAAYMAQIARFLTFASDDKPFPFAPFPSRKIMPPSSSD